MPSIRVSWNSPTNQLSCMMQSYIPGEILEECKSQLQMAGDLNLNSATVLLEMEMTPSTSQTSQTKTFALIQIGRSGSKTSFLIQMGSSCPVAETLNQTIFPSWEADEDCSSLLDGKSPDCLTFSGDDSSVTFEVPQVDGRNLKTVMLYVVHSSSPNITNVEGHVLQKVLIMNHTKNTFVEFALDELTSMKYEKWHNVMSNLQAGNKVEILILWSVFNVTKIAVYLIYAESSHPNLEHSHTTADNEIMEMKGDKNIIVPGNAKNRFCGPITIASLLISPPFWCGLAAFLIWKQRQSHKRRRSS
ncbi:hypothetical protein PIB30_081602 [Stylosanthes scabra]|uniref:Uncharacterized protein n=1 Tax=Stylosanthes scabra TaxID=79078 RepID=A0ABU6VQ97_9FABA|nr:hypothetical protein [Stylosanthes scabra]